MPRQAGWEVGRVPGFYKGAGVPSATTLEAGDYQVGDYYINTSANTLYITSTAGSASTSAWVQVSGTAPVVTTAWNESKAAVLINATSAGDAGNRSDHFDSLTKWTNRSAPSSSSVGNSSLGFTSPLNTNAYWNQPYTPSGAFRVEARTFSTADAVTTAGAGQGPNLGISDSASSIGTGNYVAIEANVGALMSKQVAGVYSNVAGILPFSTSTNSGGPPRGQWVYVAIARDGSNNWTTYVSQDRNYWLTVGTLAFTFTPAYIYISNYSNTGSAYFDFVDVVS